MNTHFLLCVNNILDTLKFSTWYALNAKKARSSGGKKSSQKKFVTRAMRITARAVVVDLSHGHSTKTSGAGRAGWNTDRASLRNSYIFSRLMLECL